MRFHALHENDKDEDIPDKDSTPPKKPTRYILSDFASIIFDPFDLDPEKAIFFDAPSTVATVDCSLPETASSTLWSRYS